MSCTTIDPDPSEVSGDENGLCTVCQRLDLPSLTGSQCSRDHDEGHFHLGALHNIIEKKLCPCCRLIATAVGNLNLNGETPETIDVTLQLRFPFGREDDEEPGENANEVMTLVRHTGALVEVLIDHETPCIQLGRQLFNRSAGTIVRSASEQHTHEQIIDNCCVSSYRGRLVSPDMDTTRIRNWIQTCAAGHPRCRAETDDVEIPRHNIRLIDVHDFRIVESCLAERYAALSYVWGSNANFALNSGNLRQLSTPRGLQDASIPQTIADAIYLVRQLEIDYLWVDSLCIIQDDDSDKYRQLPIMDQVYQQAHLVVIAATGNDAHAGLPGTTKPRTSINQQSETIGGINFNTSFLALRHALGKSSWATRGWTFQEGLLSRRALIITESTAYWDCWESNGREDLVSDESKTLLDWNEADVESTWRMDFVWRSTAPIQRRTEGSIISPCRTMLYCEQVTAFQRRNLSNQSDALWAFLGILKLQKIRFPEGFIWALPYERLDAALLWSENSGYSCMHTREVEQQIPVGRSVHQLSYPSWSWLSCDTAIRFQDPCGGSVISKVKWHDPIGFEDERYKISLHAPKAMHKAGDEPSKSKIITPDWLSGVDAVDFGLLHLTGKVGHLLVRWKRYEQIQWSYATILSTVRKEIGHLWINSSVAELQGELSSRQTSKGRRSHDSQKASDDERPASDILPTEGEESSREGSEDCVSDGEQEGEAGDTPEYSDQGFTEEISDKQSSGSETSEDSGEEVEYRCEFLLLSANASEEADETCLAVEGGLDCGTIKHIDMCEHIQSYNIMLIEWSRDIAYRRGLGIIGKDEWERNVETQEKMIVLG